MTMTVYSGGLRAGPPPKDEAPKSNHLRIVDHSLPTRAECIDGPRPCPWARCRYHLLLDVTETGTLEMNAKRVGPGRKGAVAITADNAWVEQRWLDAAADLLFEIPESCALDIALKGPQTLEAIGEALGVGKQSAQKIARRALQKLAKATGKDLSALMALVDDS